MTKKTSLRLKVVREKKRKKEEIIEKRKIEAITVKRQKNKEKIGLFSKNKKNYNSNIANSDIDLDQANNENLFLDGNNY